MTSIREVGKYSLVILTPMSHLGILILYLSMMRLEKSWFVFAIALGVLSSGCNKRSSTASDANIALAQMADTFTGALVAPLNEYERVTVFAQNAAGFDRTGSGVTNAPWTNVLLAKVLWVKVFSRAVLSADAAAVACSDSRFSPALSSGGCSATSAVVEANYSDCTAGAQNEVTLHGKTLLSFDAKATCDNFIGGLPLSSGSAVWTTDEFIRTGTGGSSVTTTSGAVKNYLSQSVGGGAKFTFGATSNTLNILGLHRSSTGGSSLGAFDHTVSTTIPFTVTGTKAALNRHVVSGTVVIDDNNLLLTATGTVTNLTWPGNCCYPTSGSVNFDVKGTYVGTAKLDFNSGTCGVVNFTNLNGSVTKLTIQACE